MNRFVDVAGRMPEVIERHINLLDRDAPDRYGKGLVLFEGKAHKSTLPNKRSRDAGAISLEAGRLIEPGLSYSPAPLDVQLGQRAGQGGIDRSNFFSRNL